MNLKKSQMIKYTFDKNKNNILAASDFQRATVGFTTRTPGGILVQMTNAKNTEYIQVEVNNNGEQLQISLCFSLFFSFGE